MTKIKIIILFFLILLAACSKLRNVSDERAHIAAKAKGEIIIGAVAPWALMENETKAMLWQGMEFALNKVNGAGGVLNRKIRIVKKDDEGLVNKGRLIAQSFAENRNMVAVIGHFNSYISIPASSIYEFSGLLMVTPASTNPKLTQQGFKYVFTMIPTNDEMGKKLAVYALRRGYKKIIIYYVNNSYGFGLANGFERRIEEFENIEIVDRLSYHPAGKDDFRRDLRKWKDNFTFDSIFLAGQVPEAGKIISRAYELGIRAPIFGGNGLNSPKLWEAGCKAVEGTVVAAFFHPDEPRQRVQQFVTDFKKEYGVLPDAWAAQGYDTVKLIVYAMEKAGSTVPKKVADVLRSTKKWSGITGLRTFDVNGNMVDDPILEIVRNCKFEFLSNME